MGLLTEREWLLEKSKKKTDSRERKDMSLYDKSRENSSSK